MEELLREAFQLGQQWVQDMNNDKDTVSFNDWFKNYAEQQLKILNIPVVVKSVCALNADHLNCRIFDNRSTGCTGCQHNKQTGL